MFENKKGLIFAVIYSIITPKMAYTPRKDFFWKPVNSPKITTTIISYNGATIISPITLRTTTLGIRTHSILVKIDILCTWHSV